MKKSKKKDRSIGELLADTALVTRAMRAGVRAALLEHKLMGRSIVSWRDGKIVTIPPEEIPVAIPRRLARMLRSSPDSKSRSRR